MVRADRFDAARRAANPPNCCDATSAPLLSFGLRPRLPGATRRLSKREDFPGRDDKNWMKHTLAWIDEGAKAVTLDYRPVHTYTMSGDVAYIEPKARVY